MNKISMTIIGVACVCSTAFLYACKPTTQTNPEPKDENQPTVSNTPNTTPPLLIGGLNDNTQTTGIDFIIDGSASMCGYFKADLKTTKSAIPITGLVEQIQAVSRRGDNGKKDNIRIFMQDGEENEARYIKFSQYENQLLQGRCDLKGQYTQLGLIMQAYQNDPALTNRSFVIISDMHLLPSEQRQFDSSYDKLLEKTFAQNNDSPNISNGILSLISPFVGQYYTVDNSRIELEQIAKHIHLFWFAKNKTDAKLIQELNSKLSDENKESVYAQAELLPQLRLLTNEAKQYPSFTPPTSLVKPNELLNLTGSKPPYISGATTANDENMSEDQRSCYTLNWVNDNIDFYPYPMAKTNTSKNCVDDELYRSKTGSVLKLNLPVNEAQYSIKSKSPDNTSINNGYLSIPIVHKQGACIENGKDTIQNLTLSYQGSNQPIDKDYYDQFSIERDGCNSPDDCSNLNNKTFKYSHLIDSLANKAKQHIDDSYPKDITISLNCEPS